MPVQFSCPKCGQKLTLTASKPGDWIDCPRCEAAVRVPDGPTAPPPRPAPPPIPRSAVPQPPPIPPASRNKWWSGPRARFGAAAAAVLTLSVVVAFAVRKSGPEQQAKGNDPAPATPQPVVPGEPGPGVKTPPEPEPEEPEVVGLDQFGNPLGQNQGLGRRNEFKGQRILFWCAYKGGGNEDPEALFGRDNPLWAALGDRGFTVRREFGPFSASWLQQADQLWVLSGVAAAVTLDDSDVSAIVKFVDSGKGLCLLADNDPFTAEADLLAKKLFGASVSGNYFATKIAYVRDRRLGPDEVAKYGGGYEVADHPLLAGVNFVYEGITISTVSSSGELEVALHASDGNPVVAVSARSNRRVVVDCGFTRYYHSETDALNFIEKTAGTPRLGQNIAAFLAGKGAPKKP